MEDEKKILIVEDDPAMAKVVKLAMEKIGYPTAIADNGMAALTMLSAETFGLIVSDIRMPHMNGIELLHRVKKDYSIPVILMTGFAEISETKEAFELGAVGFLPKPFKKQELIDLVQGILKPPEAKAEAKPQEREDDFSAIPIDDFVSGSEIQYEIFVKLSDEKFVKVAHSGEKLALDRIANYKTKGITHLFLRKEDFLRYIGFNMKLARAVVESDRIEHSRKVRYLVHTVANVTQTLFSDELNRESFGIAGEVVQTAVSALAADSSLLALLESLQNQDDQLFAHGVAVSLISSLIAKEMGWKSAKTVMKAAMGGLLHDIGKKEIDKSLHEKPRMSMSAEEVAILETHPIRGMELLQMTPGIPEEIIQVVAHHHENCTGTGFPFHLSKNKIIPLARLVAVADEFCRIAIKNPNSQGYSMHVALDKLMQTAENRLDQEFVQALAKVVHPSTERKGEE